MKEMDILNAIRLKLQEMNCKTFRVNVGSGVTKNGNYFNTGVPKGFADLFAVREDGKAVFIEVKAGRNKPRLEQCDFLLAMIKQNACAGVAYSVDDAIKIVNDDANFKEGTILALKGLRMIYEHQKSVK